MRRLSYLVLLSTVAACGEADNDLWGSIDESFPLAFDRVDIFKQDLELRVEYIKKMQGSETKVCKLTVNTRNLQIKDNTELTKEYFEDGTITLHRIVSTGGDFPMVKSGSVHFAKYELAAGGRIDGDFAVQFENGRNLFGNFDQEVKEVDTGP